MDYLSHILVFIFIYASLAMSLDLVAGHTGLVSLAHAAFFGIGAYASSLLAMHAVVPFPADLVVAALLGVLASLCVSLPSLRLHGDYFVIATFAFQMIVFSTLNNWVEFTGGPMGLAGIPRPTVSGLVLNSHGYFVLLSAAFAVLSLIIATRLTSGPFGRVLHAIREDEVFAAALGKSPVQFKIVAVAVGAMIAAVAGGLYARYMAFIDPTSFTVTESILVLSMVIVGGAGRSGGVILGAVLLVLLPEALRFVGLPSGTAANIRQIIYGATLVALMAFRPQGILGKYAFGKD